VRRRRSLILAAAAAALAGGLSALPGAQAVESTTVVSFTDCEVILSPYWGPTQVGGETSWSPSVRLEHPSPIPLYDEITVELDLGPLPGGRIPQDMYNATVDVEMEFSNGVELPLRIYHADIPLGTFDADAPLVFPQIEYDTSYGTAGTHLHRPKSVWLLFTGEDAGGEFLEYQYSCDQVVGAAPILTTHAYDLAGTPSVTVNRYEARQGQAVVVKGENFLTAAPTNPAARVSVVIGGVSAGTLAINSAGQFSGALKVPPFAKPGAVVVRAVNGYKSAVAALTIKAAGATVKAAPANAKRGKKVKLTGASFKPGEKVKLTLNGGKGKGTRSFTTQVKVKANGSFTKQVKLKKAAKGTWKVTAKGSGSGRSGKTSFKVK